MRTFDEAYRTVHERHVANGHKLIATLSDYGVPTNLAVAVAYHCTSAIVTGDPEPDPADLAGSAFLIGVMVGVEWGRK